MVSHTAAHELPIQLNFIKVLALDFPQKCLAFQQSTNTVCVSLSKNLKDTAKCMVHLKLGYGHLRVHVVVRLYTCLIPGKNNIFLCKYEIV